MEELRKRDELDRNRKFNPLQKAQDAVLIDTTSLNPGDVLNKNNRLY